MTDGDLRQIIHIASEIKSMTPARPRVAVVTGSGLSGALSCLDAGTEIPYEDIAGFPVPTVPGHPGRMIFGKIAGTDTVVLSGRVHYYECRDMDRVVLPVRVLKTLGADRLILTNAAGGISGFLNPGDIMLIKDHISSFVPSPLAGENDSRLGPRFPDMTNVYDASVIERTKRLSKDAGVCCAEGVYLQASGPNYETPAEIRMFETLGADAVGMSTAVEAMAARHAGMTVCGISCITNRAAGLTSGELSHTEVERTAGELAEKLSVVLEAAVKAISGLN